MRRGAQCPLCFQLLAQENLPQIHYRYKPMDPPKTPKNFFDRVHTRLLPSSSEKTPLPPDFVPGSLDVICVRGKAACKHPGNRRYHAVIGRNRETYAKATSKSEKSMIVTSIVDSIREASPQGGFIKQENGMWYRVGDVAVREKVSQSLRNLLHTKYSSSTKAKKQRKDSFKVNKLEKMWQDFGQFLDDPFQMPSDFSSASTDDRNTGFKHEVSFGPPQDEAKTPKAGEGGGTERHSENAELPSKQRMPNFISLSLQCEHNPSDHDQWLEDNMNLLKDTEEDRKLPSRKFSKSEEE